MCRFYRVEEDEEDEEIRLVEKAGRDPRRPLRC
jgi:hypothetical protein